MKLTPKQLYTNIHNYCEAHADAAVVEKYSKYFKEGYDAYGLTREICESKVSSLLGNKNMTLPLVLDAAPLLLKSGKFEETSFAIHLLKGFAPQFNKKTLAEIGTWFNIGIGNWAHADVLSGEILADFLGREIVPLEGFARWIRSRHKYQRRVVPVAMLKLLKTSPDVERLLVFIEPLMMDSERVVHQGVGWFLREAWKVRPEETEAFLLKWKDSSPRLIFQYATEKMAAKKKERFRRTKG